jgi:hypothetical protein
MTITDSDRDFRSKMDVRDNGQGVTLKATSWSAIAGRH